MWGINILDFLLGSSGIARAKAPLIGAFANVTPTFIYQL
jgi:hypothetical protein